MTGNSRLCGCCGEQPATCFGAYETHEYWDYACDYCCGHGNEDGQCFSLELPATRALAAAVKERDVQIIELKEAIRCWGWHDLECPGCDGHSVCTCGYEQEEDRLIGSYLAAKECAEKAKEHP